MRGRVIFGLLASALALLLGYCVLAEAPSAGLIAAGLALCVVLAALLYVFSLRPIQAVANGLNLLRAQDYASRLRSVGQKDTDNIISLFNDLMDRLKAERLKLEEQNLFLQQIIDASTQGIVIMDFDEKPMQLNDAARAMLREISLPQLSEGEAATVRSCSGMVYKVQRLSFLDRGFRRTFYLIDSLTEEVRQAERDAYGRVIRTIAHEVNNTMGGINSVMQVIGDTTPDPDIAEAIDNCIERAGKMTQFISSYASLVKLPDPVPQPADLAASLEALRPFVNGACSQAGIEAQWDLAGTCRVMLDPVLWEQAIVNIVKNSIDSILASGRPDGKIAISTTAHGDVRITDNGAGLSPQAAPQIFTPFFTTKPQGQGIGLMLVSEVLRRHGCRYSLATDPATGLTTFAIAFRPGK